MWFKKIIKSKTFWLIIALLAVGSVLFLKNKNKDLTGNYLTEVVKRGNLIQTVSATGKVESTSETNLNFQIGGQVQKIYVLAGTEVKAGQLIMSLGSGQASSIVSAAQASLAQANADLASVKAGSSQEELSVTQAQLDQARANFVTAEANLSQTKAENEQNLNSLKEQALNKANESLFLAKSSLEDVNYIINSADYKDYFKVFGFTYTKASNSYDQAILKRNNLESIINQYSVNSSIGDLVALLDVVDGSLKAVDEILDITYDLLSKAAPGGNLSQTQIDTFKSTVTTDQTALATKISAGQTAKSSLQTKSVEYENGLKDAENNLIASRAAWDIALAQLDLKKAGPRDFQLDLAQAKVAQAKANLQKALADLSDYSLRAPVDGLITKINYEKGEYVGVNQVAASLIGVSNFEIKVDVPESDIAKIKVGDLASVTLDAFDEDRVFPSHVTFIDPAETIINDVVYYKVKVTFDQKETDIKSGMTANIIILTNQRQDVLYIPQRAVVEKGATRLVKVLANNLPQEKEVMTGLRADDGLIEILSGLTEGETIITFVKETK
ncbi:MAG: efflux RND transporter periplasmic adaptor subunit [Patescibacteria group bacterium]|jgi:HlyD family secretion protein